MKTPFLKKHLLLLGLLPVVLSSLAQTGLFITEYYGARNHLESTALSGEATPLISATHYLEPVKISAFISLVSVMIAGTLTLLVYRRINRDPRFFDIHPAEDLDFNDKAITPSHSENMAQVNVDQHEGQTIQKFSILIADDNQINRLLLVNQLQDYCEHITAAQDGTEALNHLKRRRFGLIFLDLQMPGYNGFELIDAIRHTKNPNSDVPVIAVTAHALPNQCKEIIAHGFDECLIKPILSEQLEEIIALWRPEHTVEAGSQASYAHQLLTKTAFDRDLALNILNKLLEELPQQLTTIQTALKNNRWQQALAVAHKLHGSVSFCGLADIRQLALALEKSLISKNYPETNSNFGKLQNLVQRFIAKKTDLIAELMENGR